jgi:uncharacterized protein YbaR (Trm112 family)
MTLLMCPECSNDDLGLESLDVKGNEIWTALILCSNCRRWYPIINGVPNLLPDNRRKMDQPHKEFFKTNRQKFVGILLEEDPPVYVRTA